MLHAAGKFLLAIICTNWIMAEMALFWPGFGNFSERLSQKIRIPTHDEWPGILDNAQGEALRAEIGAFSESGLPLRLTRFFVAEKTPATSQGPKPAQRIIYHANLEDSSPLSPPFLSGKRIFVGVPHERFIKLVMNGNL